MNKSPWLKPVIGIVAALAVAAGALFAGIQFAPHQVQEVATGTESVPVAAPIAVGDEPVPAADDESADPPALGEREVQIPGAAIESSDPSVDAVIDALEEAPDPFAELIVLDGDSEADESELGDSCAPRDGEPSADCPDGIRSTILPLIALRDFLAGIEVFPPGGVYGGLLQCTELDTSHGEIPMGSISTAPGAFRVELWPSTNPGAARDVVEFATDDVQRNAFEAAVATATTVNDVPTMKHCFTVPDLDPETAYTGVLTGLADDGRVLPPYTFRFNTAGEPVHPGLQLVPVGESLLFASALAPSDETIDIRAFAVGEGTAPTCSSATAQIMPMTWSDTTVDADHLNAVNAPPSFTNKHSETFRVAPGVTVLVCARWFDSGDATRSWERVQPNFESSAIAQSPDRLLPSLEIVGWNDGSASPFQHVTIEVATAEGSGCNRVEWTLEDPVVVPTAFCRTQFLAASGVREEGGRIWDLGFSGDLVVRGRVELESGFSESSMLLPAINGDCRGICTPPEDHTYRMRMAGVTIDFVERWQQAGGNGRASWDLTPSVDTAVDYVQPDQPQLDTDAAWTFDDPRRGTPGTAGHLDLVVDRPVDYVVRVSSTPGVSYPNCTGTGLLEARGRIVAAGTPARVTIPDICLGLFAETQVELTDDEGNHVIWGLSDRSAYWGANALISVPRLAVTLHYDVRVQGPAYSRVNGLRLEVDGGADPEFVNERGGRCSTDGVVESHGTFDTQLSGHPTITFAVRITPVYGFSEDSCDRSIEDIELQYHQLTIDLRDLYRPEGAVIAIDGENDGSIVLRVVPD